MAPVLEIIGIGGTVYAVELKERKEIRKRGFCNSATVSDTKDIVGSKVGDLTIVCLKS